MPRCHSLWLYVPVFYVSSHYVITDVTIQKLIRYFDWELHDPDMDWWNNQGTYLVWEKLPLLVRLQPVPDFIEQWQ